MLQKVAAINGREIRSNVKEVERFVFDLLNVCELRDKEKDMGLIKG